jgi:hypothetical protein
MPGPRRFHVKRIQVYVLVVGLALGCLIGPAATAHPVSPAAGVSFGGWFADTVAWLTSLVSGSRSTTVASDPYSSWSPRELGPTRTTADEAGGLEPSG